jgi:hypothetical protein
VASPCLAPVHNPAFARQGINILGKRDARTLQSGTLAEWGPDKDNLLIHPGRNAALKACLETRPASANCRGASLKVIVSRGTKAEVMVRLNQTKTAHRAALQTGASLLCQNLLDDLR